MSRKIYLAISGTIFGSVAVAHLFRVVYQVSVHVGDQTFLCGCRGVDSPWQTRYAYERETTLDYIQRNIDS